MPVVELKKVDYQVPPNRRAVEKFLKKEKVDFSFWGTGITHSVDQLVETLKREMVYLEKRPDGKGPPRLTFQIVSVKVRIYGNGTILELYKVGKCSKQSDKTLLICNRSLNASANNNGSEGKTSVHYNSYITTVLKKTEYREQAARRCLAEELGQSQPLFLTLQKQNNYSLNTIEYVSFEPVNSTRWPGLEIVCEIDRYSVSIIEALYLPKYTKIVKTSGEPPFKVIYKWRKKE